MLTYEQIYADKQRTISETKRLVKEHCPHIRLRWNAEISEWRVAYKGLKPEREEATAQYIAMDDYSPEAKNECLADVLGAAMTMERDYVMHVFNTDKLDGTLNEEYLEALRDPNSEGPQ